MLGDPVGEAYASVAPLYTAMFGSGRHEHPDDLAFIAEHLVRRPGPVLDVGCGPGRLTGYLASMGADAAGVDLVRGFVLHAQQAYPALRFTVGSMRRLEAADQSLQGILAWYSLIHTQPEDVPEVLREFRRALAADGVLVLGLFDGEVIAPFDHKVAPAYKWPLTEISAHLARAGFTVIGSIQREAGGDRRAHLAVAARPQSIAG